MTGERRASPSGGYILVIAGPIDRARIPELCRGLRALLEAGDAELVVCDCGALTRPTAAAVDALARLQLTARRHGGRVRLRRVRDELRELVSLLGLRDVLPIVDGSGVEPGRQAEEREQRGGIEEEGDPAEPVA